MRFAYQRGSTDTALSGCETASRRGTCLEADTLSQSCYARTNCIKVLVAQLVTSSKVRGDSTTSGGRFGSIVAGAAALGLAACGTSANTAAETTSASAPTTTAVVTQVVTETVKTAAAQPRKAKPKSTPTPTPAPTSTAAQAPTTTSVQAAGPIMPNVVGKDLDTASGELDSEGIQYALNSDGEHVILKFDWGVCSTSPAAGQSVSGVVVLNLGHFSCGA